MDLGVYSIDSYGNIQYLHLEAYVIGRMVLDRQVELCNAVHHNRPKVNHSRICNYDINQDTLYTLQTLPIEI